jgi:uncharacterized membrane protein (UPF0127 family)
MSGQATITIRDQVWNVNLAIEPWELTQGLGGLAAIPPGSGMLFDLGAPQIIQVTTVPMLFPLDIAFLSENLVVTEIYRDIQPGYLVTSTQPARFFLEVNAGELEGINAGDTAAVEVIVVMQAAMDWTSTLMEFIGFALMAFFMTSFVKAIVRGLVKEAEKKPVLYGPRGEQLLPDTRLQRKFFIQTDRMGDIIITRPHEPGKSVFLQFEADREIVYEILKKPERDELDKGWEVEIEDSEPRASTLQELWDNTGLLPDTKAKQGTKGQTKKPTRNDVSIDSWVERDRIGIWLTDKRTDKTIAEWWDEDAAQMFEDGFFKSGHIRHETITGREFEKSVLDYSEYIGILEKSGDNVNYLPQTIQRSEAIEIPFKDAPSWVQEEWKKLHPGSVPHVHVHRTNIARIDSPVFDYAVRDVVASKAGRTMTKYVPAYDSLLASSTEEKALYFGGSVKLNPDEAIAVMDFWGDRFKNIDLYIHPAAYEPPKLVAPSLTDRQMKILATIRAYTSTYRKEVFGANKVTTDEVEELQRLGLIDRRGAITVMGRNVVGNEKPLSSYFPQTVSRGKKNEPEVREYRIERISPDGLWRIVELWPGGTVRTPFESKEEAIQREEDIGHEYGWNLKRVGFNQKEISLLKPERFPKRARALASLGGHHVIYVHDDGDLTVRSFGKFYVVTTEGQVFGQEELLQDNKRKYVKIITPGETTLTMGSVVPFEEFEREVKKAKERGEQPATAEAWGEGRTKLLKPRLVRAEKAKQDSDEMDYLPDSPEFLTQTIEDIGYRDRIDNAFKEAIARSRKERGRS